jgi:ADP-heptose:LPS heptosyltransferase
MGDFFCSVPAFAAIRQRHPDDHLALMTTRPYTDLAHALGYFDDIITDLRPRMHHLNAIGKLRNTIISSYKVYDLQCSQRTTAYRLLSLTAKHSEWFCMPWDQSWRTRLTRYSLANLPPFAPADFRRFKADLAQFGIRCPFALIVPGSSKRHADDKRWPIENYIEIARYILTKGIQPVVVGGADEDFSSQLSGRHFILDISGKTGLVDLVSITNAACFAVGNDTGAMHLAALCGIPLIVLMSGTCPSERVARGGRYRHLIKDPIREIAVHQVTEAFDQLYHAAKTDDELLNGPFAIEQDLCRHA